MCLYAATRRRQAEGVAVSEVFYALAALVCPLSMGAMMLVMMRGRGLRRRDHEATSATDAEIAALRTEVDQLRRNGDATAAPGLRDQS
jgi:hypothetical protein